MKNILLILTIAFLSCSDSNVKPQTQILTIDKPLLFEKNNKKYEIRLIDFTDWRCRSPDGFGGMLGFGAEIMVTQLECTATACSEVFTLSNFECRGEMKTTLEQIEKSEPFGSNNVSKNVFGFKIGLFEVYPKRSSAGDREEKIDLKGYQLHLVVK